MYRILLLAIVECPTGATAGITTCEPAVQRKQPVKTMGFNVGRNQCNCLETRGSMMQLAGACTRSARPARLITIGVPETDGVSALEPKFKV